MKSLCNLLGCVKTRTAPSHPESDGMVERFNRTCLMMLSMFVNDRRDNWNELLPFVMHAYRTSVHESTGYSPFRLMMGEECSLPQDVSTDELRTNREHDVWCHILLQLGYGMLWKLHMIMCVIHYISRPPVGRDCTMLKLSIANFRWGRGCSVTIPSGGPKEIGISLDRAPASRAQGYRPYGGHSKGSGSPHHLHSC